MDVNSSKHAETGNSRAEALRETLAWLQREGGQQRNVRILQLLIEKTLTAVLRGDPPPEEETTTLRLLLQEQDGTQAKAFRAAELGNWWGARTEQLRQVCARQGCTYVPTLVVNPGGGRGLPSRLLFEFLPIEDPEVDESPAEVESGEYEVRYRMDPAKPALWLRALVGARPFPVQSWRGYVLIGTAVLDMLIIGLIWWSLYVSWMRGNPITTGTLAQLGFALFVTGWLWWLSKPVRELPTRRVTMAGPMFLALSELYGQLRTMPAPGRKLDSREFAVVRHWGTCPICAAEVDLDLGGKAFPDRLVGRCHDAPLEHVFSFDPVRLLGKPLRHAASADASPDPNKKI